MRADLETEISALETELEKRSFTAMLSGPYDTDDALLAIHAGAGGTDSQDWAAMLMRMYLRWAEKNGYRTEILDLSEGEEAESNPQRSASAGNMRMVIYALKKAYTGWCAFLHLTLRTGGIRLLPWWRYCPRLRSTARKSRSIRRI